ncbi:MAG: hypothetical protein JWP75_3330 [Frondihabitans sp.]|nr:hypothetical protein [Frondihabitans sp.]
MTAVRADRRTLMAAGGGRGRRVTVLLGLATDPGVVRPSAAVIDRSVPVGPLDSIARKVPLGIAPGARGRLAAGLRVPPTAIGQRGPGRSGRVRGVPERGVRGRVGRRGTAPTRSVLLAVTDLLPATSHFAVIARSVRSRGVPTVPATAAASVPPVIVRIAPRVTARIVPAVIVRIVPQVTARSDRQAVGRRRVGLRAAPPIAAARRVTVTTADPVPAVTPAMAAASGKTAIRWVCDPFARASSSRTCPTRSSRDSWTRSLAPN